MRHLSSGASQLNNRNQTSDLALGAAKSINIFWWLVQFLDGFLMMGFLFLWTGIANLILVASAFQGGFAALLPDDNARYFVSIAICFYAFMLVHLRSVWMLTLGGVVAALYSVFVLYGALTGGVSIGGSLATGYLLSGVGGILYGARKSVELAVLQRSLQKLAAARHADLGASRGATN